MTDYLYDAKVLRVIDGDTVVADLDCGLDIHTIQYIRLNGIDTPELRSAEPKERELAQAAKDALMSFVLGKAVEIETIKDRREGRGRYLGKIKVEGLDVNAEMIRLGHARPYDGGKRLPWV